MKVDISAGESCFHFVCLSEKHQLTVPQNQSCRRSCPSLWRSSGRYVSFVLGNPGIGKSFGLLYALRLLLKANKLVFFHYTRNNKMFVFVPPTMQRSNSEAKTSEYEVFLCKSAPERHFAQLYNPDTFLPV